MAYNSAGLYAIQQTGRKTLWALDTTDIVGDADATGYITDGSTAGSGKGAPGKGMKLGDMVFVTVVDSVSAPTTISDTGWYYVSTVNATTGACTITACGAS